MQEKSCVPARYSAYTLRWKPMHATTINKHAVAKERNDCGIVIHTPIFGIGTTRKASCYYAIIYRYPAKHE